MILKNYTSAPIRKKSSSMGLDNFVWTSGSGREKICGSREKFSIGKRGAEEMTFLKARGPAELGLVAFGSATQGLFAWETEK